jgi:hypothetical protein
VRASLLNSIAAVVFFAAVIRDWFFPGVLQITRHPAGSDDAVVWVAMGCICMAAALAGSTNERNPAA